MQKLLVFLAIIFGVYLMRRILSGRASHEADRQKPVVNNAESMVECAHCHLLVPESEGIKAGGVYFCSAEHRQLGKKV